LTGGVYTKGKKAFINGRIEICAKLNAAKGAWPAIWMLPEKAAILKVLYLLSTDKRMC
jgi:beta-glucanase (GH16 family)